MKYWSTLTSLIPITGLQWKCSCGLWFALFQAMAEGVLKCAGSRRSSPVWKGWLEPGLDVSANSVTLVSPKHFLKGESGKEKGLEDLGVWNMLPSPSLPPAAGDAPTARTLLCWVPCAQVGTRCTINCLQMEAKQGAQSHELPRLGKTSEVIESKH